jgi:bifunctional non-homologous end joining protein LigD
MIMAKKTLEDYQARRDFRRTPEPSGGGPGSATGPIFVVQKHDASRLHYDFRLEVDGVLKSWAVPKGPSTDPKEKRLAVPTEDHPLAYAGFEGVIPAGEYGGGTVMVWDTGTYAPDEGFAVSEGLKKGELKFTLHGKKLKGSWVLVRTRNRQWLLIKHRDERARPGYDVAQSEPFSARTRRTLAEIAEDEGGDPIKAATGDPERLPRRSKPARRTRNQKRQVWDGTAG